ncbi:MAG TPA: hypothetical protein ACFYEK_07510 [Candidatus Wunengus sp. YC60]|uniref:hypothetical protein n=1 Tax=Candidatus Wunengus sp. YC60 TaxID=3367697 RepID=UPI004029D8F2
MKKAKKKKIEQHKEGCKKMFAEIYASRMKDFDMTFDSSVKAISKVFGKYNILDIAISLFTSSLWLPNVASPIKHQLLLYIFATLKPEDYSNSKTIASYDDFKNFLQEIYSLLPSFEMLEDFVPEADWGEIKFHHEERNFKIFYGSELSNVYDYLTLYQMLYLPFESEYYNCANRSPTEELENCLQLQDDIISGIPCHPTSESLPEISPGYVEIPQQKFWENAVKFYINYKPQYNFSESFLKNYSIQLGDWPREHLKWDIFQDMIFHMKILPAFFISHNDQYFPFLPRRYSSILFDSWSKIFEENHDKVIHNGMSYSMRINAELHRYIKARINSTFLHPLVSAVTSEGKLHEILFSTAFISKDKLILIYVTNPHYSKKNTEEELNKIAPKLKEAIGLISIPPVTLALHLNRQNVQYQTDPNEKTLNPILFVVIPQVSTENLSISIPKTLHGTFIFMDHFLGIIDELENSDMLASFIEYLEEYEDRIKTPIISLLDIFGSFKSSRGVLVEGALEYDFISIDPHWGSNMRYETLSKFWELYPKKHFFDHPRSWKVTKETESRIRLESRGYFGCALYCRVGSTHVFINSPFDKMSYKQMQLANLLMECLEDAISGNAALIEKHKFFQIYDQFKVLFFPLSLISGNDDFKHLKHLNPKGKYWCSDYLSTKLNAYGIRIVFDDKSLADAFTAARDRSLEIDLLLEVITQLNAIVPDPNVIPIRNNIEAQKAGRPRFKMLMVDKKVSFPELVNTHEPTLCHFKKAKKKIAELAKKCNLAEGYYTLEDAKIKLNELIKAIVTEINSEVEEYDFKKVVPYLLTRIDALDDQYVHTSFTIKRSLEHDVDYKREENYARQESDYIIMHKNYRYLIEKFVQLQPHKDMVLDKEQFQYLIALIDWLHIFYSASDSLHYGIHPLGMKVDRNFLVEVVHKNDSSVKEKEFAEEAAKIKLGLIGNPTDRVYSPRSFDDLLDTLDNAFKQDFGFSFRNMINVLQILSRWTGCKSGIAISPFYSASADEIKEICKQTIKGISQEEIYPILNFLTLRSYDVVHLVGQEEACPDLPVWEYKKRYARYNLKPLIIINNKYYWGPHSTSKSGTIWSGKLSYGALPTDLQSPTIKEVLRSEKKFIEDALEVKAFEIIKRYTPYARLNAELHKLDNENNHPLDLGDYDVLAFYPGKNIILNIECKDILPAYCPKDAKRLRDTIFGKDNNDEGHFRQINKRRDYLSLHLLEIAQALKWPIAVNSLPKIITIYLTRITYWLTKFPPKDVKTAFLQVDMLSKFIEDL